MGREDVTSAGGSGYTSGVDADESDKPQAALVRMAAAPPFKLARSLEEATQGSFVHVDNRGQVRSPARYRMLSTIANGASLVAVASVTALYAARFGTLAAVAVAGVFGATVGMAMLRGRRLNKAARLLQADRLDEAETLCRRTLSGRLVQRRYRAVAHQSLAAIAVRRGQFETALGEARAAMELHARSFRRSVYLDMLAYFEIGLLVNLGRVREARERLDARGPVPEGNYLKLQHWTADLSVQFAEGRLQLDEEQLWVRSKSGLQITRGAQLLALCAWAYFERGDADLGSHLLEQAVDRAEPHSARSAPGLWRWVEEKRPKAE
jgi:tetratricopeptide (TPR) repeat protein